MSHDDRRPEHHRPTARGGPARPGAPRRRSRAPTSAALAAALAGVLATGPASAQGVPEALAGLDAANGEAWIAPFADALAPALTAGFFTTGGRGGGFRVGLRVSAGITPAGEDTFAPRLPTAVELDGVTYSDPWVVAGTSDRTPSASGDGPGLILVPRPGSAFEEALDAAGVPVERRAVPFPAGLDLARAPLTVVEAGLALRGLGVQLVGRFTPTLKLFDELGDVSAFGGGVLVTVSRYLPVQPVEIGVSAVTQKLHAADWLDGSASALGLIVSRAVGPVHPYVHGSLASAEMELSWTVSNPEGRPFLPPDGSVVRARRRTGTDLRLGVGASLDAGPLGLSAEYLPGAPEVVSFRLTLLGR